MVARNEAAVYDFAANEVPGATDRDRGYWRDVGTLDAYYDAHMDLISVHPIFNLYNLEWPILTHPEPLPPAKFVFDESDRRGTALDSMVCAGVVISGGTARRSVLSPGTHLHSYALVEDSIVMQGVAGRPPRHRAPGDRRQERPDRARAPRSGSTPRRTAGASTSRPAASSSSARAKSSAA